MPLAIFDIDGTLTLTSTQSRLLYQETFQEVAGLDLREVGWKDISSSTDSGIVKQIFLQLTGKPPADGQPGRLAQRLAHHLALAVGADPRFTRPVPGSVEAFHGLASAGWHVAIASGSWRATARVKLGAVGIDIDAWPGAFGDDALFRAEIIDLARQRADQHYERRHRNVVYVGDGAWDAKAAAKVGICFVGIGNGKAEDVLRGAGASQVLDCYQDFPRFLDCLGKATCPAPRN